MAKSKTPTRGGRPKGNNAKTHFVAFRVTLEEHVRLLIKAQKSGMTLSDYARSRAMRGYARTPKTSSHAELHFAEASRELFHEVRRQGVNLNQIAHHCNRHQVPPPAEISELLRRLQSLWDKLLGSS